MRKAAGSWLAIGFVLGLAAVLRRAWSEQQRDARRSAADRAGDGDVDVPDDELAARVRERVAIPAGVELAVEEGAVVLFGRVPRYLARTLLERVSAIEGVAVVEDRLTPVDLVQPERPPGPPDPP